MNCSQIFDKGLWYTKLSPKLKGSKKVKFHKLGELHYKFSVELKLADRRVQYLVYLTKNEKNCSRQSDIICLPAKIQLGLTGKVRRRGMGR